MIPILRYIGNPSLASFAEEHVRSLDPDTAEGSEVTESTKVEAQIPLHESKEHACSHSREDIHPALTRRATRLLPPTAHITALANVSRRPLGLGDVILDQATHSNVTCQTMFALLGAFGTQENSFSSDICFPMSSETFRSKEEEVQVGVNGS